MGPHPADPAPRPRGFDHEIESALLGLVLRPVFPGLRRTARAHGVTDPRPGAVTLIQRAGGALNLAPPFHALVLAGVFSRADPQSPAVFHASPDPSDDDIADLLLTVRGRILRGLERRGLVTMPAPPSRKPCAGRPRTWRPATS